MREVNFLELKFREQAVEYFKNCSERELYKAILTLNEEDIFITDWSCEKCKEKYGECEDEIIFSDDPWGEFCIKRFHAWGMEH